MIKKVKP